MQTMSADSNWPIVDELEKQYDVVQVDPTKPITEKYDVLLAVQPSSLGPEEMDNFIAAVEHGQPTAIFEDPFPALAARRAGHQRPAAAARRQNPMIDVRQQGLPKGDISRLWSCWASMFPPDQIIWQDYNPYPKIDDLTAPEFVFVDHGEGETTQPTPSTTNDPDHRPACNNCSSPSPAR